MKIKILKAFLGAYHYDYDNYSTCVEKHISGFSDWTEVTEEEFAKLKKYIEHENKYLDEYRWILIVDEPYRYEFIISDLIKKYDKEEKARLAQETKNKKLAEAYQKEQTAKKEAKKAKRLARLKKQLEQLESEAL